LRSKYHEERFVALVLLVQKFRKAKKKQEEREKIVDFYLSNIRHVNNWDLVDTSAPNILGVYLFAEKDRSRLYTLARSQNVWSRRISIIATMYFIKNGRFEDTLKISEILLGDGHDLIHKAVGWALREVYKRQPRLVEEFLKMHLHAMPRTTLRYAIEKVPKQKRAKFLKKTPQR
jgi:3-methyladenine DNA glycosylase AlkD